MASVHVVNGAEVKERNPFGVWGLAVLTLGIYSLVWYYKVNKEMRRAQDIDVDPAMTVVAMLFGWVLLIPPYVAMYRTGRRIERAQFKAGIRDRISPVGSFLLGFIFGLNMIYMQSNLNKMWGQAGQAVQPAAPHGFEPAQPATPIEPPRSQRRHHSLSHRRSVGPS